MAQYEHLPIYRKAFDVAVYVEDMVKGFSRYHKYTLGTEMRDLSRALMRLIVAANSQKDRVATLEKLRDTIEEMKVVVRIGKEVKAFRSFKSFMFLMEQIVSLGRQCEGWIKSMRGKS